MKFKSEHVKQFQPITVSFTIESEEELAIIRSMCAADVSIPKAVSDWYSGPTIKPSTIIRAVKDFLDGIKEEVNKG